MHEGQNAAPVLLFPFRSLAQDGLPHLSSYQRTARHSAGCPYRTHIGQTGGVQNWGDVPPAWQAGAACGSQSTCRPHLPHPPQPLPYLLRCLPHVSIHKALPARHHKGARTALG